MSEIYLPVVVYRAENANPFEPFFEITGNERKTVESAKAEAETLFTQTENAITAYVENPDGERLWDMEEA